MQLPIRPKKKFEHQVYAYYEGEQEKIYFNHLKELINSQPFDKIKSKLSLVPKKCEGGDPRTPVKMAVRTCIHKQPFVVFDYDNKKNEFEEALDLAQKNNHKIGYSNINFDYWLALHKVKFSEIEYGEKQNNDAYVSLVKRKYELNETEDIKQKNTIHKIVKKITLDDVYHAIRCCELIDNKNQECPTRRINTANNNYYYKNPDFQIHKIVKLLLHNTLKN